MREILFRGKRRAGGEWAYGFYVILPLVHYKRKEPLITDSETGTSYEVDPSTVGQYTGLTDKNGKWIFEGDICRVKRSCVLAYGNITFRNGCFWFVDYGPGGMLRLCDIKPNGFDIEIIGNIHDNQER